MTGALASWEAIEVPEVAAQAATAVDRFTATFERPPEGVWWAPGRVNLIGEHVDYHDGLVLPMALPIGTAVAVATRPDERVVVRSAQREGALDTTLAEVAPGAVGDWASYVVGVPWALRRAGHRVPGIEVWVEGAVPPGAGLSSSAALECSVAVAIAELAGLPGATAEDDSGRAALAQACIQAENEIAGASTGGMDQSVALRARTGRALLLDCRDWGIRQLDLDGPLAATGTVVLVVDTRAHHSHAGGEYGDRRALSSRAARRLGVEVLRDVPAGELDEALARLPDPGERAAVRHVVTEIDRVRRAAEALEREDATALGALFRDSHASLRDDYRVSSRELDAVVEAALRAGALGARMTGGGFGGSAVVLCGGDDAPDVSSAVGQGFAERGWPPPRILGPTGAGGAALRVG